MVMIVQNNFFFNKYFQITRFVRPVCHENIFFFLWLNKKSVYYPNSFSPFNFFSILIKKNNSFLLQGFYEKTERQEANKKIIGFLTIITRYL